MAGKFEVTRTDKGGFHFNLLAGNGQVILSSQVYSSKDACLGGIDSVRRNAADEARFERKTASDGRPYFVLNATNGQVIGSSQMYADERGRDNGIASVQANAPDATLVDSTAKG